MEIKKKSGLQHKLAEAGIRSVDNFELNGSHTLSIHPEDIEKYQEFVAIKQQRTYEQAVIAKKNAPKKEKLRKRLAKEGGGELYHPHSISGILG